MAENKTNSLMDSIQAIVKESLGEELSKVDSQEQIDNIHEKYEKIDLDKMLVDILDTQASDITRDMRDTMYEQVTVFRAEEQEFIARQERKWYKAFVASESMYIMTLESSKRYREDIKKVTQDELKKYSYTFNSMLHIHGRALQQFLEIITLMKNGFADGAYARWRSMYELTVIASYITENGEEVAKSFIKSSETDDRYEWARVSGLFPNSKRHITFNDIQKKCGIDSTVWAHQYNLANKTVHASPQGTFKRLGNASIGDAVIPVGRSDYGITTAGEHSAISLAQITTMFFSIYQNDNSTIAMQCITNWIDVIREEYFKGHDYIFPDEEKLWDDSLVSYEEQNK